jgi:hypothetical protein
VLPEIDPEGDRVDVHEDLVASEVSVQPVVQAARDVFAVFASIRDEDPGNGLSPTVCLPTVSEGVPGM